MKRNAILDSLSKGSIVWALACLIVSILLTGTGCSNSTSAAKPTQPPVVEVAEVVQKDVPLYREWIGTLDGLVNADIKAQVSGYLTQQAYTEGTFVKQGQLLFQIDPRPFQASLDQAQAQLAQSEGQLEQARAQLAESEAQVSVAEANQRRIAAGRGSLYTARAAAGHHPTGPGQRHTEQYGCEGAATGGHR